MILNVSNFERLLILLSATFPSIKWISFSLVSAGTLSVKFGRAKSPVAELKSTLTRPRNKSLCGCLSPQSAIDSIRILMNGWKKLDGKYLRLIPFSRNFWILPEHDPRYSGNCSKNLLNDQVSLRNDTKGKKDSLWIYVMLFRKRFTTSTFAKQKKSSASSLEILLKAKSNVVFRQLIPVGISVNPCRCILIAVTKQTENCSRKDKATRVPFQ